MPGVGPRDQQATFRPSLAGPRAARKCTGFQVSLDPSAGYGGSVALYLVERYLPGMSEEALRSALERVASATAGTPVRYIGSTIVVEDESCFCHFDAPSADVIAAVNERAGMPLDRIVPALRVAPATG